MKKARTRPAPFRGNKDAPRRGSLPLAERPTYPSVHISSHIEPDLRDDKYLHSHARGMNGVKDDIARARGKGWDYPATTPTKEK